MTAGLMGGNRFVRPLAMLLGVGMATTAAACSSNSSHEGGGSSTVKPPTVTTMKPCNPTATTATNVPTTRAPGVVGALPTIADVPGCLFETGNDRAAVYPPPCGINISAAGSLGRQYRDFADQFGSFAFVDVLTFVSSQVAGGRLAAIDRQFTSCHSFNTQTGSHPVSAGVVRYPNPPALGTKPLALEINYSAGGVGARNQYYVFHSGRYLARVITGWGIGRAVAGDPIALRVYQRLSALK